jgi:hypothetical protein
MTVEHASVENDAIMIANHLRNLPGAGSSGEASGDFRGKIIHAEAISPARLAKIPFAVFPLPGFFSGVRSIPSE